MPVWNVIPSEGLVALLAWAFGWGVRIAFPERYTLATPAPDARVRGIEGRTHPPCTPTQWNAFLVIVGWWREIDIFGRERPRTAERRAPYKAQGWRR